MDKDLALDVIKNKIENCTSCNLCYSRTNVVPGEGNLNAEIMFCGEGPGQQEDERGRVFVGKAGNLLTKWVESLNLTREEVFITNVVKCRPPNNRNPNDSEVEQCLPYLEQQIEIVQPKVLVLLGSVALKSLFKNKKASIMRERGTWKEYHSTPVMPTYHPAFLLRQMSEENKNKVKSDLQKMMDFVNENQG